MHCGALIRLAASRSGLPDAVASAAAAAAIAASATVEGTPLPAAIQIALEAGIESLLAPGLAIRLPAAACDAATGGALYVAAASPPGLEGARNVILRLLVESCGGPGGGAGVRKADMRRAVQVGVTIL